MSQADELLESMLSESDDIETGNIVIGADRFITIPESLKRIAVQYDHNAETVTFDCPRYWDEHDMSTMKVYVNYMRSDEVVGSHLCDNVLVDENDDSVMHFDWTISGHVTYVPGPISFLVCVKDVDSEGNPETYWNSELNSDLYVSNGMKSQDTVVRHYPDIITQLLTRMDVVEDAADFISGSVTDASNYAERAYLEADRAHSEAERAASARGEVVSAVSFVNEVSEKVNAARADANTSASNAKTSETNAGNSATNADNSAIESKSWAVGGTGTRDGEDTDNAKYYSNQAKSSETNADISARDSDDSAKESASWAVGGTGTRDGEDTDNAKYFSNQAKTSASTATSKASEASGSATNAASSASAANTSASNAKASENNASNSAANADTSASNAKTSETNAKTSETNAGNSAIESKSWAVGGTGTRTGEDTNNAKYWSQQAKAIAGGEFATPVEAQGYATTAENNAKAYTDEQLSIIDCGEW